MPSEHGRSERIGIWINFSNNIKPTEYLRVKEDSSVFQIVIMFTYNNFSTSKGVLIVQQLLLLGKNLLTHL